MRGKDEEGFYQRHKQNRNDYHRDHADEFTHGATDEEQRRKSGHRRKNRENHRHAHLLGAGDGRRQVGGAPLSMFVDVFSDHDGIIDHDPQGEDKGKQGYHIDRNAQGGHEKQRAEKGDGDAEHHPHGEADFQKQTQDQKHQDQTENGIFEEQIHAAFEQLTGVVPGSKPHARWQIYRLFLDIAFDQSGNLGRFLIADPKDFDHGCRLAVEGGGGVGFGEGIPYHGDIPQADFCAVRLVDHNDIGITGSEIAAFLGTQKNFSTLGADSATGQVQGSLAYPLGHLLQSEIIAAQLLLGDLYGYFVGAHAPQVDLGDLGIGKQLVTYRFGTFA